MSRRLTHAEMLPAIRAENEAWRAKHLPLIHERQAKQQAERDRVSSLMRSALGHLPGEDRALIFRITGIGI